MVGSRKEKLSTTQRRTAIGAVVTGAALGTMTLAGAPDQVTRWLKTPPIVALFAAALAARPSTPTLRLTTAALGLSAFGDALLTRPHRSSADVTSLGGMASFAAAYLALTAAFGRGGVRPTEVLTTAAVAANAAKVATVVWPYLPKGMRPPVVAFCGCIGAWGATALAAPQRGWFPAPTARRVAGAALLMTASDSLVALHMFHPRFHPIPAASELVVRLTYLIGWTLLLLVVQEPAAGQRRNVGGP